MIEIKDKKMCCGCGACAARCAVGAISLVEDREGFLYPEVDISKCIDCGECEMVCPELNREQSREPLRVVAAKSSDTLNREQSSSGGVFWHLAKSVIESGGVVFGAAFDNDWGVVHRAATDIEEVKAFRGSKYSQSRTEECYAQVEQLLNEGREVLFSATPCCIAALKLFLGRDYERLLCVDVACHGVPSPKVWRKYIASLTAPATVSRVNFRDKSRGWFDYNLVVESPTFSLCESHIDNLFMQGFIKGYSLRPSCFECPARGGRSLSDLTLADFWSVRCVAPHFADNVGVSLVVVGTPKGLNKLSAVAIDQCDVDPRAVIKPGSALYDEPREVPFKRSLLFESIEGDVVGRLRELLRLPLHTQIIRSIKRQYSKFVNR